jgi:hypothetical protein
MCDELYQTQKYIQIQKQRQIPIIVHKVLQNKSYVSGKVYRS